LAALLLLAVVGCSSGGTAQPQNPWSGTRTTTYILRGDLPNDYRGPDGLDPLIQAQIKQALTSRTIELDLYEVENSSGALQSIHLHNAHIISYLSPLGNTAYQIPGTITQGQGITRIELNLAGATNAWVSLVMRTSFESSVLEAGISRIRPYRHVNPVYSQPVEVVWEIVGMNGSRLVNLECRQRYWLYGVSTLLESAQYSH
jgi:hypothetical protein